MKQFILFLFVLLPFCVASQVNEMFDGPELGSDWIGKDRDSFKINEEGRLQLAIKPVRAGNLSIGKNIMYSANMQWEFDVYMQQAPSNDNKLCVYLYQENVERYYYVRIGNTGTKELGLMRHGKAELVAPRTDFADIPLLLHIKVTLENNEQWTLYSRTGGKANYKLEGSGMYAITVPPERGNMIFTFYYTKSRSDLFCIDNVCVSDQITPTPLEPDEPEPSPAELPQLLSVEPVSTSMLCYTFDKPVEIREAVFHISEIGEAYRKTYVDVEKKTAVNALFEDEMEVGKQYTISYQGVTDLSGNNLADYSEEVKFEVEDEEPDEEEGNDTGDLLPGSILINEVMAKPGDASGMVEYVELYNNTSAPVSLSRWEYKNVTGKKVKVLPDVTLDAGNYAVLYSSGKSLSVDDKASLIPIEKFPALNDQGASLHLYNAFGTLIDSVTYAKASPGKSWERSASGWHLSTDPRGGTPGSVNSSPDKEEEPPVNPDEPDSPDNPDEPDIPVTTDPVQPRDIIINELLPDPYAGGSEYIELYNRSDNPLSLSALSVATRKSDGTLNTRYPLAAVPHDLKAKNYLLLTKNLEGVTSFYDIADPSALCGLAKLPVLANTSSTLVLFRSADETVIDEVAYSSKWHAHSIKNQKGVALERIDPDAVTQDAANWTSASATAGYGTPGYQNSQYKDASSGSSTGIEPPVWIEESGSYTVSYLLDRPGYSCRAFVFNTSGQRVAEISNHELLGTSGEITWGGIGCNGSPLQTGVYIFYAEIYHPEGTVRRFKKAFLIR
ncbi:lamin tail domain-containing protein [Parabacteroides sp.]